MSGRKIVFLGDCQANALMQIYRDFVVPLTDETVGWVNATQATEAELESIREADAVVSQVFNVERNVTAAGMRPSALKVEFPAIFVGFLWPFSGQAAHARNVPTPRNGQGAYPAQLGDTFLNKLINEGVAPEEALQRYLDLDLVRVARLDRLLELHLAAQASRDGKTGFAFSQIIAERFRDTQLFLTTSHPTLPLAVPLIEGVFERLGVPAPQIATAVQAHRVPPFPNHAVPIHPAVIRHFGLRFVDERSRYPYNQEGSFTFAEFVIRYMNYTWNEDLAEGIVLASGQNTERAYPVLERGLRSSPESIGGWQAMSSLLRRMQRLPEARAAARRAVALAPENPASRVELARVLLEERDIAGAEAEARRAIASFPADAASHHVLAMILAGAGRAEDAVAAAKRSVALRPGDAAAQNLLADLLLRRNDLGGAEAAFRMAARIRTPTAHIRFRFAQTLFRKGNLDEAHAVVRELLAAGSGNPHLHALLGHILTRRGDLRGAEAAFRKAAEIDPAFAGFRASLAQALSRQGKDAEALGLLWDLVTAGSSDPHVHSLLGQILARRNDLDGAAAAFHGALALQPSFSADLQRRLADVQRRRQRSGPASAAARESEENEFDREAGWDPVPNPVARMRAPPDGAGRPRTP